jgi:hypothetical protein
VTQATVTVQLVADLEGYYTAGNDPTNAGYGSVTPTRLIDTRHGIGGVGGRVSAGDTVRFKLPASVPAGATAVVLNVTVVGPSLPGYLEVFPDGTTPNLSNVNFSKSETLANQAIVAVPADREIDFTVNAGSTDLVVDLDGYFSPSATAKFVPAFPSRLFDTRTNFLPGPLKSGYWLAAPMAYDLQVPVSALTAVQYNVTVTQATTSGYIAVVPDPINAPPSVSSVNFAADQTVANSVLAPMTDGWQDFYNGGGGSTQVLADFFGYFAQPITSTAPPTSADAATRAGSAAAPAVTSMSTAKAKALAKLH